MATNKQAVVAYDVEQLTALAHGLFWQAMAMSQEEDADKANERIGVLCSAIATMIATTSGVHQMNLMDAVNAVGFLPTFYGNSIRVSWGGRADATAQADRDEPPVVERTHFIAEWGGAWGKSTTIALAKANLTRAYGSSTKGKQVRVWRVSESTVINGDGAFTRSEGDPAPVLVMEGTSPVMAK